MAQIVPPLLICTALLHYSLGQNPPDCVNDKYKAAYGKTCTATGTLTFYSDGSGGGGACGPNEPVGSDPVYGKMFGACPPAYWGTGNRNLDPICLDLCAVVQYGPGVATEVKCQDLCPECSECWVDLSFAAFESATGTNAQTRGTLGKVTNATVKFQKCSKGPSGKAGYAPGKYAADICKNSDWNGAGGAAAGGASGSAAGGSSSSGSGSSSGGAGSSSGAAGGASGGSAGSGSSAGGSGGASGGATGTGGASGGSGGAGGSSGGSGSGAGGASGGAGGSSGMSPAGPDGGSGAGSGAGGSSGGSGGNGGASGGGSGGGAGAGSPGGAGGSGAAGNGGAGNGGGGAGGGSGGGAPAAGPSGSGGGGAPSGGGGSNGYWQPPAGGGSNQYWQPPAGGGSNPYWQGGWGQQGR